MEDPATGPTAREEVMPVRRGYVHTADGSIHYRAAGETGEHVLLLHPTPFSSDVYTEVVERLSDQFQVVAIDTLGFGDSDEPPYQFEMSDYAAAVIRVLDGLGWEDAHLVGKLTGAVVAAEVAATAPGRVLSLVLSAMPDYDPEIRVEKLAAPRDMTMFEDGRQILTAWNASSQEPKPSLELRQRLAIAYLKHYPRGEDAHTAIFKYDIKPRLAMIDCPTLLLYSEKDMFLHRENQIREHLRRVRVEHVPGSGMIHLDAPDQWADILRSFFTNPQV